LQNIKYNCFIATKVLRDVQSMSLIVKSKVKCFTYLMERDGTESTVFTVWSVMVVVNWYERLSSKEVSHRQQHKHHHFCHQRIYWFDFICVFKVGWWHSDAIKPVAETRDWLGGRESRVICSLINNHHIHVDAHEVVLLWKDYSWLKRTEGSN